MWKIQKRDRGSINLRKQSRKKVNCVELKERLRLGRDKVWDQLAIEAANVHLSKWAWGGYPVQVVTGQSREGPAYLTVSAS